MHVYVPIFHTIADAHEPYSAEVSVHDGGPGSAHVLSLDLALCACHMTPVVGAPVSCSKRKALEHSVSHLHSGIMGDLNFL